MRLFTPEISWHQREPIYSLDFQPKYRDFPRLATVGVDGTARLWKVTISPAGNVDIEYLSTIRTQCGALNTIRFSPDGEYVAFGGVSTVIYIAHQSIIETKTAEFGQEEPSKETWISRKTLRGHLSDVQVLDWAGDSQRIVSGSIDNTIIIWNVSKGELYKIIRDSKGYVQGVAFDPRGQFVASVGNDRVLRVYGEPPKLRLVNSVSSIVDGDSSKRKLWCDEAYCSLFRRLEFSRDGSLLVVTSGSAQKINKNEPQFSSYVFSRDNFARPIAQLPHFSVPTLAVRFSPKYYTLRGTSLPIGSTPYRQVYAVASLNDVLFYDTEQGFPFAMVSGIHCTPLSDLSWRSDGLVLAVCSTDGYISFIEFEKDGELGDEYTQEVEMEIEDHHEIDDVSILTHEELCDVSTPNVETEKMCSSPKRRRLDLITLSTFKSPEDCNKSI